MPSPEGIALVTASLAGKPLGPYRLQAAIAAVHDEAPTADDTDWPQILALYRLLERMDPGPTVTLNRAVAEAMVHGPRAGLDLLATLTVGDRVSGAHRFDAVRAHLLEMAGEHREAYATYQRAARRTASIPERRYLLTRSRCLPRDGEEES
jgi:predicted RNA polymerase sigma factor